MTDMVPVFAKKRTSIPWSAEEIEILRKHYPMGGVNACAPLLSGRNADSIIAAASKYKIKKLKPAPRGEPGGRTRTEGVPFRTLLDDIYAPLFPISGAYMIDASLIPNAGGGLGSTFKHRGIQSASMVGLS